ncbi:MAG: dTMP kinase [Actinomycetota bacterium]
MTFVVLEGGEGSGKSTQVGLLSARLAAEGLEVVTTFEPGDTPTGRRIRETLLHGDDGLAPTAELLLMLADRAQHVAEVIRPALARGAVVVCDRFSPSTIAYQGVARGLGVAEAEQWCEFAAGGLVPDAVVVLDVADAVAEARVGGVRDRMERAGADFHARVRAAYRDLAPERDWLVVDGSGTPEAVADRVRVVLGAVLPVGS